MADFWPASAMAMPNDFSAAFGRLARAADGGDAVERGADRFGGEAGVVIGVGHGDRFREVAHGIAGAGLGNRAQRGDQRLAVLLAAKAALLAQADDQDALAGGAVGVDQAQFAGLAMHVAALDQPAEAALAVPRRAQRLRR